MRTAYYPIRHRWSRLFLMLDEITRISSTLRLRTKINNHLRLFTSLVKEGKRISLTYKRELAMMKRLIFAFTILVPAFGQALILDPVRPVNIMSGGEAHTCAVDVSGVKCWGSDLKTQVSAVPAMQKPVMVASGVGHSCALDEDLGVLCWGEATFDKSVVPALNKPYLIAAGANHTCAVDEGGIKCWGDNVQGQLNAPVLKNPTMISANLNHTCALDDEGVKCWGSRAYGETRVPALNSPESRCS